MSQTRTDAFRAESAALTTIVAGLTAADLERPSPCPPWTVAGLVGHIVVAVGRVGPAVDAAPEPGEAAGPLIDARGYYRPDHRFSPAVNADRIDVAAALAARAGTAAALAAELSAACEQTLALLASAPPEAEVRTRHGDRMRLTDFAVTRVVELGVHGLDLALALDRPPWLTSPAAAVIEDLLLPDPAEAARLPELLHCDRAGVIARLTGRAKLSPAEQSALAGAAVTALALG
jgi:uncharacterized protein (TIGR03083 family)